MRAGTRLHSFCLQAGLLPPQLPFEKCETEQQKSRHRAWSSQEGFQGGLRLGLAPEGKRSASGQEEKYPMRNTSGGPVTEEQTSQPGLARPDLDSVDVNGGGTERVGET